MVPASVFHCSSRVILDPPWITTRVKELELVFEFHIQTAVLMSVPSIFFNFSFFSFPLHILLKFLEIPINDILLFRVKELPIHVN